jgi:DNA-binding response OmpR family regulator
MARIALLESNTSATGEIAEYLRNNGNRVVVFGHRTHLLAIESDSAPSVLVFEQDIPDGDGLEAALSLAMKHKDIGLIMLSNESADDRVNALRRGVDHCLSKPYRHDELLALVNNLARRLGGKGDWQIDSVNMILHTPDGHCVSITNQEHIFLKTLNMAPARTRTRVQLVQALSRGAYDERSLDSIVARLRKKVSAVTNLRFPLKTVHGTGYSLNVQLIAIPSIQSK